MDGERLQELRKDRGLKQKEFAEAISVSLSSVKAYEQGRSSPDDAVKIRIAELFNISLDYLIGATDDEIPLKRQGAIELPRNFPAEAIPDLKEYMEFLKTKYKKNRKPRLFALSKSAGFFVRQEMDTGYICKFLGRRRDRNCTAL